MNGETVNIRLRKSEALILFELLADFGDQSTIILRGRAERLALARLHGALEKTLVEPFSEEYKALLDKARAELEQE